LFLSCLSTLSCCEVSAASVPWATVRTAAPSLGKALPHAVSEDDP
jgi:hypothetical protein